VLGAHLKQQSRDILPPPPGRVHGDKLFNVHVAFGFDRDESAVASARSLHATAKACARRHSSGQSIASAIASANVFTMRHGRLAR
jgi:hypothetical protein